MDNISSLQYSDGNGNLYNISKNSNQYTIEYLPVKPELSSSGLYSGGEYKLVNIRKQDFYEAMDIFLKVLSSNATSQAREMGTGLIIIKRNDINQELILTRDSADKVTIEFMLKKLLSD